MFSPGQFLQHDWYKSREGKDAFTPITYKNWHRRRIFGLLERPSYPPHVSLEEFRYKIFVSGKSGVGKTSSIAKLTGNEVPTSHSETPGIQTSSAYWPVKLVENGKVVMFHLQFWDAGENAMKKFDHIVPACKEKADAVMFLFSFVDKASFEDLPQLMSRILEPTDDVCKMVMGTKYDLHAQSETTQRDIKEFEYQWRIPVLRTRNVIDYQQSELRSELNVVAPLLNSICEQLWHRDQILTGRLKPPELTDEMKISFC